MRISALHLTAPCNTHRTRNSQLKCKADVYSVSLENEVLAYLVE